MRAQVSETAQTEPELRLLLLEPEIAADRRTFLRAGVGSIVVHVLIGILVILIARLPPPAPPNPPPEDDLRKSVHLVISRELTQKAPNKAQIAKELTVENLLAKPDIRPVPPRKFVPPPSAAPAPQKQAPAILPPPQIAQSAPVSALGSNPLIPPAPAPPPKPAEQQPKLAFEKPGVATGGPAPNPGGLRIAPPKTSLEDTIRGAGMGGGGGAAIGDNTDEPSPFSPPRPGATGAPKSSLELLSDPMGVDFKPYLIRVLTAVRRNWFAVIPESARLGHRGRVVIQFAISKDGRVPKLVIVTPSGVEALDRAAVAGISASNPFPPLPTEFRGDQVRLQFVFAYNLPSR